MAKLIEKELSYEISGVTFEVYKTLGGGYQEKYYQRAIAKELKNRGIKFTEQLPVPLTFKGENLGRYFLDFLIEDRIVLEVKVGNKIYNRDIKQVLAYLHSTNKKLGIIALFTRNGVNIKRILKGK